MNMFMNLVCLIMSLHLCQPLSDFATRMEMALKIYSGFGMSIKGVRTCGDYMFSGHTVVVTMFNFFITECKSVIIFTFKIIQ